MNAKGFTLIELVVVLSIFILIFGAATTVLISIIQHERAILAQQQALNELSYVEEFMSKGLRMAKTAQTAQDIECVNGNLGYTYLLTRYDSQERVFKGIKFIDSSEDDTCVEFFLDSANNKNPTLKVLKNSTQDSQAIPMSSSSLIIKSLRFALNGQDGGILQLANCANNIDDCGVSQISGFQPRVTMLFDFTFKSDLQSSHFIQTTVSKMSANQ
jgi:prepilin-type N-terminal cleavage/methylation domain-containing protein